MRAALAKGDVDAALSAINDADASILDKRPELSFALQQQRLIEMARKGDVEGALAHAREYLAPAAGVGGKANDDDDDEDEDEDGDEEMMMTEGNDNLPRSPTTQAAAKAEREQERASAAAAARLLLPELERTVALLAFDDPASSPLADLLSQQQRAKVAALANAALLEAAGAAGGAAPARAGEDAGVGAGQARGARCEVPKDARPGDGSAGRAVSCSFSCFFVFVFSLCFALACLLLCKKKRVALFLFLHTHTLNKRISNESGVCFRCRGEKNTPFPSRALSLLFLKKSNCRLSF